MVLTKEMNFSDYDIFQTKFFEIQTTEYSSYPQLSTSTKETKIVLEKVVDSIKNQNFVPFISY